MKMNNIGLDITQNMPNLIVTPKGPYRRYKIIRF